MPWLRRYRNRITIEYCTMAEHTDDARKLAEVLAEKMVRVVETADETSSEVHVHFIEAWPDDPITNLKKGTHNA